MSKDADLEDAPVTPEMGTIELRAYRCQKKGNPKPSKQFAHEDPHWGRISERSKKAGWHYVAYVPPVESYSPWTPLILLLIDPCSTGDEIRVKKRRPAVKIDCLDPLTGPPYASIKIFYRPRGKPDVLSRSPFPYFIQSY